MSRIGHNNPPKDRKVDWKSVSLNKYVYKQLQELAERRMHIMNCFGLLNGKAPCKTPSIPYIIELLVNQEMYCVRKLETQDNGRNVYEQTAKKLIRSYNSKRGLKLNAK
jgi:hypothetical protein